MVWSNSGGETSSFFELDCLAGGVELQDSDVGLGEVEDQTLKVHKCSISLVKRCGTVEGSFISD